MNIRFKEDSPLSGDIVVVQSVEIFKSVMEEVFSCAGARVSCFSTADAAMGHISTSDRACMLVIADHSLPGRMQGTEFMWSVREKWPNVSVILISGYTLDSSKFPSGTAFILKPWSIDDLVFTAASLLGSAECN